MPNSNQESWLGDFATQAGQQALGGIMGLVFGGAQDRRQLRQAEKLQRLQMAGMRQMGEFNQAQQMEMWHNTNYSAQKEELKKAGLNPGLLYGMGGAGGATAQSTPGNVSGYGSPTGGGEAVAMAGQAMQLGLLRAQKENIEADTELKKVDATKKEGVDTRQGEVTIENIIQDTKNKKAQEALIDVQKNLAKIDEKRQNETYEQSVDRIIYESAEAMYKQGIAEEEWGAIRDQRPYITQTIATKATTAILENALIRAETSLKGTQEKLTTEQIAKVKSDVEINSAQIKKWVADVYQGWAQLGINEKNMKVNELVGQVTKDRLDMDKKKMVVDAFFKALDKIIPSPIQMK